MGRHSIAGSRQDPDYVPTQPQSPGMATLLRAQGLSRFRVIRGAKMGLSSCLSMWDRLNDSFPVYALFLLNGLIIMRFHSNERRFRMTPGSLWFSADRHSFFMGQF